MRFQAPHENIRRDLEDDVWYEKDGKSNVSLVAFEVQVFREVQGESVGYIDPESTSINLHDFIEVDSCGSPIEESS